ncbi:MAG: ketoacyl-ACP synthase III [Acidaminococcales bacterium]|jgi:3-oxoacyl-[acyl-carrier-protein] synthase-3|nr:ketoacyl-ACP synthase III [Acidaminococcales bacterium]
MRQFKQAGVLGVAYSVPDNVLTNQDLEKMVDTSDKWITERTGIKERRIAAPGQATSDMSLAAGQKALDRAGVKADEIDLVIVCTLSPDTLFPSTACIVQYRIGAVNAGAFDLSAGCSGFVYGLSVACQMVNAGAHKKILVIGAETLSRILNWKDRNTCVLFADGAGAAVIGEAPDGYGYINSVIGSDGAGGNFIKMPAGGSRMPATAETVANNLHAIHMDGSEVFKFASRIVPKVAFDVLKGTGIAVGDIDIVIPHQANGRIIKSAAKRLGLPIEKFYVNVERYGNTSAASVPIALAEAWENGLVHKGNNVLLIGFGTGLTWAGCLLKWSIEGNL